MKVLHLYKGYAPLPGGIEGHIQSLAETQAGAGHEVTVLVARPGWRSVREEVNGVQVIRAGAPLALASVPLSLAYFRVFAGLAPDVVHLHVPYPPAEVAAWRRGLPYVVTYHAEVSRFVQRVVMLLYAPVRRRVLSGAVRVLVASGQLGCSKWLCALNPVVIPFGVNIETFTPGPGRSETGRVSLLFVGRLRHYKGLDVLLRALARLPGPRLVIAGEGPEGPRLRRLAARLGLGDRVRFAGNVSPADLPPLYRSADAFLLPATSPAEAFGIVLLEAMASGLPCITTEVGTGTSWVVQDGVTGLVVPPSDPAALAGAIRRLAGDAALRARMGAAGRARVEAEFTQERMVQRVEEVYREVAARS